MIPILSLEYHDSIQFYIEIAIKSLFVAQIHQLIDHSLLFPCCRVEAKGMLRFGLWAPEPKP